MFFIGPLVFKTNTLSSKPFKDILGHFPYKTNGDAIAFRVAYIIIEG